MGDERALAGALLEFTDTLGEPFDATEYAGRLARRAGELVEVPCSGVVLADEKGSLRVVGATDPVAHTLQTAQLRAGDGPGVECYRSGRGVRCTTTGGEGHPARWPAFCAACARVGLRAVHAVPLRLRDVAVGTLSLFLTDRAELGDGGSRAVQSLADAAAIGILQQRSREQHEVLAAQLQRALDSRIVIEQAKGVLAERMGVSPAQAFEHLRRHARSRRRRLHDVAGAVLQGGGARVADLRMRAAPDRDAAHG